MINTQTPVRYRLLFNNYQYRPIHRATTETVGQTPKPIQCKVGHCHLSMSVQPLLECSLLLGQLLLHVPLHLLKNLLVLLVLGLQLTLVLLLYHLEHVQPADLWSAHQEQMVD